MLQTVSGDKIFPIGIGTWGMGGTWEKLTGNEQQSIEAIRYSISRGQNFIDSAEIYGAGYTDEIVGQAIQGLDREKLYITDKIWETSVGSGKVRPAVKKMLAKLGTDYLDMLYIHKPWDDWPWREAVDQIDSLIDEGLVRAFGVSNFDLRQLKEVVELSRHPILANQLEYNVSQTGAITEEMKEYCAQHDITLIAYRPLAKGLLLENEALRKTALSKGITPAQVALAWLLGQSLICIPMALEKKYIDENIDSAKVILTESEIKELSGVSGANQE